jgi:hypothetical protein
MLWKALVLLDELVPRLAAAADGDPATSTAQQHR